MIAPAWAPGLAAGVALSALLVGCSSNDKSAVCSDLASLKTSVQGVRDLKLENGALAQLQLDVATVRDQLATLRRNAKSEFSTEIGSVQNSVDALSASASTAEQSPSAASLAAVGTAAKGVGDAVQSLGSAVTGTCK